VRASALALITIAALLTSDCERNIIKNREYNFMIIIDKNFIKQKTQYDWLPRDSDSFSSSSGSRASINGCVIYPANSKDAAIVVAVVLAAVIVVAATIVTIHNVKGTNICIVIDGDDGQEKYELNWGINRLYVSEKTLLSLEEGTAKLKIVARGTRKLEVEVPIEGMKIKRDVHIMEFTNGGKIIVDGIEIDSPYTQTAPRSGSEEDLPTRTQEPGQYDNGSQD